MGPAAPRRRGTTSRGARGRSTRGNRSRAPPRIPLAITPSVEGDEREPVGEAPGRGGGGTCRVRAPRRPRRPGRCRGRRPNRRSPSSGRSSRSAPAGTRRRAGSAISRLRSSTDIRRIVVVNRVATTTPIAPTRRPEGPVQVDRGLDGAQDVPDREDRERRERAVDRPSGRGRGFGRVGEVDEDQRGEVGRGRSRPPVELLQLGEVEEAEQRRREQEERLGDRDDPERGRVREPSGEVRRARRRYARSPRRCRPTPTWRTAARPWSSSVSPVEGSGVGPVRVERVARAR